jgi:hypothetical protein
VTKRVLENASQYTRKQHATCTFWDNQLNKEGLMAEAGCSITRRITHVRNRLALHNNKVHHTKPRPQPLCIPAIARARLNKGANATTRGLAENAMSQSFFATIGAEHSSEMFCCMWPQLNHGYTKWIHRIIYSKTKHHEADTQRQADRSTYGI